MPIYMDLHHIPGASHNDLADAHKKDLAIQDSYGVKFMTYWYDEERNTAFCLVDAPDEDSIRNLHGQAHGDVPHQIIPVDIMAVKSFLGRIADSLPEDFSSSASNAAEIDAAFRVIMFTDLKDSTAITSALGDVRAMELLNLHNGYIRNALRKYAGSEVKHTGDGIMASFTTGSDAVQCAIAIQQTFAAHNVNHVGTEMYIRIGLHGGEPVEQSGDLFGATIQMAARLCDMADPEQILVSSVVKDLCHEDDFSLFSLGLKKMKGFTEPIEVYEIPWAEEHHR